MTLITILKLCWGDIMHCYMCQINSADIINSIIGVIGTLLGTILGWILHLLSDNIGKTRIYIDDFFEQRSNDREYAYYVRIFFNNASSKQQSFRNISIVFKCKKEKNYFESIPTNNKCDFQTIRTVCKNKREVDMLKLDGFSQLECFFSDFIDNENYNKILDSKKIYLKYKDKKNHIRKKLIKRRFNINEVEKIDYERFP